MPPSKNLVKSAKSCLSSYFIILKSNCSSNKIIFPEHKTSRYFSSIFNDMEMIFLLLSKMNIFTYFWLKNPHPDIRFALISLSYEETASQDTSDSSTYSQAYIIVPYYKRQRQLSVSHKVKLKMTSLPPFRLGKFPRACLSSFPRAFLF